MDEPRKCCYCDAHEDDDCASVMTYCHSCNRTICVDNCVAAQNEEHGLDFCHACVRDGLVEIEADEDEEE